MSVTLTEDAVKARTKTVTRRLGWTFLQPGDRLTLCRKVMGRKADEPVVRLAEVEVIGVRREPLWATTPADVQAEGLSGMSVAEFIEFFCLHMKCTPNTEITRIEWRYLGIGPPVQGSTGKQP